MSDDQDIEAAVREIQASPLFQAAERAEAVLSDLEHNALWRQIVEMAGQDERNAIDDLVGIDVFDRKALLDARVRILVARAIPQYLQVLRDRALADQAAWETSEAVDI